MTWIDITQTLAPGMAVWPGDPPLEVTRIMSLEAGDFCNVGAVAMSLHTGTHAEAPGHFEPEGTALADCDLNVFMGPAYVLECAGARRIDRDRLQGPALDLHHRVLLKTGTGVEKGWHTDFAVLTTEAAEDLVRRGVRLVGIDTPSVDEADSRTHAVHRILAAAGVVVLENLRLSHVAPGAYELLALPLKLSGVEASPVRAVLRKVSADGERV